MWEWRGSGLKEQGVVLKMPIADKLEGCKTKALRTCLQIYYELKHAMLRRAITQNTQPQEQMCLQTRTCYKIALPRIVTPYCMQKDGCLRTRMRYKEEGRENTQRRGSVRKRSDDTSLRDLTSFQLQVTCLPAFLRTHTPSFSMPPSFSIKPSSF